MPITIRKLLSGFLAGCIFLSLLCPAAAAETDLPPETTVPEETTEPATTAPEETTEPAPTVPEETEPAYTFQAPYNLYFGLLHAHTDISDGMGSVEEAFSHAAAVEGLDFFAVTDHSNSFDNADAGSLTAEGSTLSSEWAAGKAAAEAVTGDDFLGLFGFEMTWPEIRQLGHITTFGTPGWISREQEGFRDDPKALEHYFDALAQVPGSVSQFCHPGSLYGDFSHFRTYQADFDRNIQLLEVLGEGSIDSYIQALDQYWHLAPTASQNNHNGSWGSENDLRTVVLADDLTKNSLFDAIRVHRVYATEDRDLHLYYTLDGQEMGSILSQADRPEIALSLWDPTDTGECRVEVIADGGVSLAQVKSAGNEDVVIPVSGGFRWYFLKITQADGDVAVTAPVWVEGFENMGIDSFTADTSLPIQGKDLTLTLELFNEEPVEFSLTTVEIYAGDHLIHREEAPGALSPGGTKTLSFPYTHPESGTVTLRAVVRGSVLGRDRSCEADLPLRFRPETAVTSLLIDGAHGNLGLDSLSHLKRLAEEAGMTVTVVTGDLPLGGKLLIIPPLQEAPGETFLEDVIHFLQNGGSMILMAGPEDLGYENTLLEAVGSLLQFQDTLVPEDSTNCFNSASPWCAGLSENQFFRHGESRVLNPDCGGWLVKDRSGTHVLLGCQQTPWGGTVFAAGSPFLLDAFMPEQDSHWLLPYANQSLIQTVLGTGQPALEPMVIGEVRRGDQGETYRMKGYVTAGTANPHTIFPDTIYLQDDTGGIAVTGISLPGLEIGTPMEVIGILRTENGIPVLEYIDHQLPEERHSNILPRELSCETAMDDSLYGGELVQLTGTVTELTLTEDRKGITRLTIQDSLDDFAYIEIEESIRSGSSGENTLAKEIKKGRTVRVIGLIHRNSDGETVLRVRNCDEVVYIPPKADPTNPKTADPFRFFP